MSRFRGIKGRIGRVEGGGEGGGAVGPHVLRVNTLAGETIAAAHERYNATYARHPRYLLVIPAKPTTPEEQAIYETRLFEQQRKLVAEARRERVVVNVAASEPRSTFPKGGTVAPPKGRAFPHWIRNK